MRRTIFTGKTSVAALLLSGVMSVSGLLFLPGTPAQAQSAQSGKAAQVQYVTKTMSEPEFVQDLKNLKNISDSQKIERFKSVRAHSLDRSILDTRERVNPADTNANVMSQKSRDLIESALSPAANQNGNESKSALMAGLNREQLWGAMDALDRAGNFRGAYYASEELLAAEQNEELQGVLHLNAARYGYFAHAGANPKGLAHIQKALTSSNSDVRKQAKLWTDAIKNPGTAEELTLTNQIWKTVQGDLEQWEKAFALTIMMAKKASGIITAIDADTETAQADRDAQKAKVLAIASCAAFQIHDLKTIQWAQGLMKTLKVQSSDVTLAPDYYEAFYYFSSNDYETAASKFKEVFLTGTQCDIAANAGYMLSACYGHLSDEVAAIATAQATDELYPAQDFVIEKMQRVERDFERHTERVSQPQVTQYIDSNYRKRIDLVRAERERGQKMAQVENPSVSF